MDYPFKGIYFQKIKILSLFLIALFAIQFSSAQNPSIHDCLGAIPVCQKVYVENLPPTGFGEIKEINNSINCIPDENNSIWYVFTVNKTGKFGFLLTPNDPTEDYDWALFDMTNANCEDIFDNPDLLVSCNAAGRSVCAGPTGATGETNFSIQGQNCLENPPSIRDGFSPFNDLVDVVAGNTYVLLVNHFEGTNGYEIDFGLSTDIGIFDEVDPVLESPTFSANCDGEDLAIQFSEYIQCATIDVSNFQLMGPNGAHSLSFSSVNCDAGGLYSKNFNLSVTPPLLSGQRYDLGLIVDGISEALDLCDNPASSISFSISGPSPNSSSLDLGPDVTTCPGENITLDATITNAISYLWQDGSTDPMLVANVGGTYSVTVTTDCGEVVDEIEVNIAQDGEGPSVDLGEDFTICSGEVATLNASFPGAVAYNWQDQSTNPELQNYCRRNLFCNSNN